jgi:hypothetical protein
VTGFLTHAAGDAFAHTMINSYTGAAFHFTDASGQPAPTNALKHLVLEGYVAKRSGAPASWNTSITEVDDFIYRNMIDAPSGTELAGLLSGASANTSFVAIFSKLRDQLNADIDAYTSSPSLAERVGACGFDFNCAANASAQLATETAANAYRLAWRDDITAGLRALPEVSHSVARALFFTVGPDGNTAKMDVTRAHDVLHTYALEHVLSMAGAPDAVGLTIQQVEGIIDQVLTSLGIPQLQEALRQIRNDALDYLVRTATGLTLDQLKDYATNPERYFDQTLGLPSTPAGTPTNLATFNKDELGIVDSGYADPNERFAIASFAAAHNTNALTKLAMLRPAELNRLMSDLLARPLNGGEMLDEPNALLGYIETLDGSRQWYVNDHKLVAARDCSVYRRLFLPQSGETTCAPWSPGQNPADTDGTPRPVPEPDDGSKPDPTRPTATSSPTQLVLRDMRKRVQTALNNLTETK